MQTIIDYATTIDIEKELSMIQRTDKGKQATLYFSAQSILSAISYQVE